MVDVAHACELSKPSFGRLAHSCQTAVRSRQVFAAERDLTEGSIPAPLGSRPNERGERLIWLDRAVVDRLRSLRGPSESFSDVILKIAAQKWEV